MSFQITSTDEVESHLRALSAGERRLVSEAVQVRLVRQATTEGGSVKRLRPNRLFEFQLSVRDLRVLYNVEGDQVILQVVGRKVGNKLIVKGREFHDHQDDPTQRSGG